MFNRIRRYLFTPSYGFDRSIVLATFILLIVSLVLITSSSIMESYTEFNDEFFYAKRQFLNIVVALFLGVITLSIPTSFYKNYNVHLLLFALFLIFLVLVIGIEVNNAKRWIKIGPVNIQPAEVLKLFWILYFSSYVCRRIYEVRYQKKGFLKPFIFIVLMAFALLLQPDYGSTFVITVTTFAMLFVAGAGLLKYLITFVAVAIVGALLIVVAPYRVNRVMSFLDPWQDQFGDSYQLTQSLMAFGRGGIFGEGLGNSIQKLGYLPEAHNDFISSILAEEMGFVGVMCVVILEFFLVYKAVSLSFKILRQNINYQALVSFGIGAWFFCQTIINIGMASGALPTKGLTLPLVSYGGSSLIMSICAVAILLRIDYEWRNRIFGIEDDS